jgi:parvulin-like peptidyl-prolyl isomerase
LLALLPCNKNTYEGKISVKFRAIILALLAIALSACSAITGNTVARVDSVILSRQDLDARITRLEKGLQKQVGATGQQLPSKLDLEQEIVSQFINQNIVLNLAKQRGIAIPEKEIDTQIEDFKVRIPQATGGTLDEAVQDQLGLPSVTSSEFRQFVTFFLAQSKLSESLVTTDTVRLQVTQAVMAQASQEVEKANVAHILVASEEEAKKVIERLDKGEDFAALAAELSTDPGSKDNGGIYENITKGQFVPEFEQAMFVDLQPGETTKVPVQTQFGYHVIRLISRSTGPAMSAEEAQQTIEQQIPQALQQARGEALQTLVDEERTKAIAEKRIQEPVYPTPTPAPVEPVATPAPASP